MMDVRTRIEVDVLIGRDVTERQVFDVNFTCDTNGDDILIYALKCVRCGFRQETFREPTGAEATVLEGQLMRMIDDPDSGHDAERDSIMTQLREAAEREAYEATVATNPYSRNFDGY